MAAGIPIAMIPLKPFQEASERVRTGIFVAPTIGDAYTTALAMNIDYVFVGEVEQRQYPGIVAAMAARPDLFPPAFSNDAVTIYALTRADR
jgi:hypothetical protein